jgi:hypothetical protein
MSTLRLRPDGDFALKRLKASKPQSRIALNLPHSLQIAAEGFAEKESVSLKQLIASALAEEVGAKRADKFFATRRQWTVPLLEGAVRLVLD